MMQIVINPGTEKIEDPKINLAFSNMDTLIEDTRIDAEKNSRWIHDVQFMRLAGNDHGWFPFLVWRGNRCAVVNMPGCPLEDTRHVTIPEFQEHLKTSAMQEENDNLQQRIYQMNQAAKTIIAGDSKKEDE